MGDGTTPEPPIDSGGDNSSEDVDEDETQPTGLDDHTPESSPEDPEETEETDNSSTPSGAPTGGGPSGGGAPVGDAPTPTPTPEETPEEEPNDDEESEPESPDVPETPEESQPNEEREQPEHEQPDHEEPEDSDDTEREDSDDDDDDDDDDEEEKQEAQIVIHSDAWDSIGWGIYPVRLQLKEEYGDQVQFDDRLVPVRDFDSSEEMIQYWEKWEPRHGMPVNTDIWEEQPPKSTELANRAFAAARKQSIPLAKRFMRRLRIAAIVEGVNIENQEILFELAQNVGLDADQLKDDWDDVNIQKSSRDVETPKTTIHVDGETITQPGLVTVNDLKTPLKRAGLEADDPQPLPGFVDEYGPVAMKEIKQVYDYTREEALGELNSADDIVAVEYGNTTFWTTP
jgi:predicted DsbA family dithiol-disulfide isomerase